MSDSPHEPRVVDPTTNVIALVVAESRRQDDLRAAEKELADFKAASQKEMVLLQAAHQAEVGVLRENYQEKIQRAEASRLDSIRQVDREEVTKTAIAANTAIATLARQTTELASTLQRTVSDTAAAAEMRNSAQYSETSKRLLALELSSSEGKGKQTVADPAMERLSINVEKLVSQQSAGSGKSQGIDKTWSMLAIVLTLIIALASLFYSVKH